MWTSEEKNMEEGKSKNMNAHGLASVNEYNFVLQHITISIYRLSFCSQVLALLPEKSVALLVFPHKLNSFQVVFLLMVNLICQYFF